jgi:hypothetical protein
LLKRLRPTQCCRVDIRRRRRGRRRRIGGGRRRGRRRRGGGGGGGGGRRRRRGGGGRRRRRRGGGGGGRRRRGGGRRRGGRGRRRIGGGRRRRVRRRRGGGGRRRRRGGGGGRRRRRGGGGRRGEGRRRRRGGRGRIRRRRRPATFGHIIKLTVLKQMFTPTGTPGKLVAPLHLDTNLPVVIVFEFRVVTRRRILNRRLLHRKHPCVLAWTFINFEQTLFQFKILLTPNCSWWTGCGSAGTWSVVAGWAVCTQQRYSCLKDMKQKWPVFDRPKVYEVWM